MRKNTKVIEIRIYKNKRFRPILDGVKNQIYKFKNLGDILNKIETIYECKVITKIATPKKLWICVQY